MLYLAEVQKQKSGFISSAKAELKLLAYQRADQSWNPVQGEEVISAEGVSNLNAGALVLAELNANRQVQRVQEAGRPLVSILQNFSRQLEKFKSMEEEIAEWKESLNYQSQELNSRQLAMEARLEQLQKMEDDFKQLEAQGLEEQQTQFQLAKVLDEATACQIQELLNRLSNGVTPTEALQEQLNLSLGMVATHQSILDQHWQQLEQQRESAQQQQEEVDRQNLTLQNSNQEWQQAQSSLEQLLTESKVLTSTLNSKQEDAQLLNHKLHNQEEIYQQIHKLAQTYDNVDVVSQIDVEALEKMPLNQLQQIIQELQRDLHKACHFVNEQEEELKFNQQAIDEVQAQLNQANEYDRTDLEMQLVDEQDRYRMLNETLVGQRKNLRERQQILSQRQAILWRRQGIDTSGNGREYRKTDLQPILVQIEAQRQQQTEELHNLEQQISDLRSSIQQAQEMIDHQAHYQEMKRQELQYLEQNLLSLRATAAECWGRVNLYQQMLQPVQDGVDGWRYKLEAIAGAFTQLQETGDYQLQAIAQLRLSLLSIMPSQESTARSLTSNP